MLTYGFELEFVIHHDFIESSVVDVAREKWTETAKWEGGGQDVERKWNKQFIKENYMIEFTTILFIWHGN